MLTDKHSLTLDISPQPDDTSCGPTCLHGVYRYFGDDISLQQLIRDVTTLELGGTLGVYLGLDALRRGYRATLYSYNLNIFDPTWFSLDTKELMLKLKESEQVAPDRKQANAIHAYYEFLRLGGKVCFEDLSAKLLRRHLDKNRPILTGLSATYLYQNSRENPDTCADNDIGGEPQGHFVVLTGYDRAQKLVDVADPYPGNPLSTSLNYQVTIDRLITAILLGVLTYDGNLLIIQPKKM